MMRIIGSIIALGLAIGTMGCSTPPYPRVLSSDAGTVRPATVAPAATAAPTIEAKAAAEVDTVADEEADDFGLDDLESAEAPLDDPLEGLNRAIFAFNDVADRFLLEPIARTYGFIVPDPAKEALQKAYRNLRAPARFANDLLQGEVSDAGTTGGRFLINSTLGLAGFFDPAEDFGLEHHVSDFGQTLNSYGVGSGPYLVLPLLGPSTARDGVGLAVDSLLLDPLGYLLPLEYNLAISGGQAVVTREALIPVIDDLRETSLDPYASLRAIFAQNRARELDPVLRGRTEASKE